MLPPSLLHARSFVSGCVVYLLTYLALAGVMFYVTLLFQDVEGWSPLRTGFSWLSMNIPFIVAAEFAGRLRRRFQPVVIVVGGCVVGAVGVAVLALLSDTTSFGVAFVGYVLLGIGWGTLVPGVVNVAMRDVPLGSRAVRPASSAARQVGTSVGLAVLGPSGWRCHERMGEPQRRGAGSGTTGAARRRGSDRHRQPYPRCAVSTRAVASFTSGYHRRSWSPQEQRSSLLSWRQWVSVRAPERSRQRRLWSRAESNRRGGLPALTPGPDG